MRNNAVYHPHNGLWCESCNEAVCRVGTQFHREVVLEEVSPNVFAAWYEGTENPDGTITIREYVEGYDGSDIEADESVKLCPVCSETWRALKRQRERERS